MDLYNRGGFSQGYYKERNGRDMIAISRPNHAGVPATRVLSQKGRELTVETLTDIHKGDLLELNLQRENYSFGKEIPKGTKTVILVPKKEQYQKGQVLNRIRNQKLMTEMKEQYLENMGVDLDDMMHGSELLSNRFVCWLESNCVTCSMYGDEEETEIEYDKEVAALGASTEAWIG
jgi:hypothetical protein